jgi:hypothetical protein
MTIAEPTLQETYWEHLEINEEDLEFLYNQLLEIETPQTSSELVEVLIKERIRQELISQKNHKSKGGTTYLPKDTHKKGDRLIFPLLELAEGEVIAIRAGQNPDYPTFDVLDVEFGSGVVRQFAAGIEEHKLNDTVQNIDDDPSLDPKIIIAQYQNIIAVRLSEKFKTIPDLVQIAGAWFPRSLLVDVNIGYLNLAEAVLEVASGGPLSTKSILEQIELPTDVNLKLTEFSMNLALQEDDRFDEVGPAGETLWFLKRLEPEGVQNSPQFLRHQPTILDPLKTEENIRTLNHLVFDELEAEGDLPTKANEITVSLIFPHWRSGTIPLSKSIARLFPTAYEAPRVQFTFIDEDTQKEYSGWVVRPHRYVYGLRDWYEEKGMIPGSLFIIKQGKFPGQVVIQALKKRSTKEWIRTVLVGTDGGIVFTMLKQQISTEIDERMAIAVPDIQSLDAIWEQPSRQKGTPEKSILAIMRELIKLSPQGHVHAQELYAAVNIVRRCPPSVILNVLDKQPNVVHMGDLYFRLNDQGGEE